MTEKGKREKGENEIVRTVKMEIKIDGKKVTLRGMIEVEEDQTELTSSLRTNIDGTAANLFFRLKDNVYYFDSTIGIKV